jgi:hypothetical protein
MNHLRSDSGSNGLTAKDSSPLLGNRPILYFSPNTPRIYADERGSLEEIPENQMLGGAGVYACHSKVLRVAGFSRCGMLVHL